LEISLKLEFLGAVSHITSKENPRKKILEFDLDPKELSLFLRWWRWYLKKRSGDVSENPGLGEKELGVYCKGSSKP